MHDCKLLHALECLLVSTFAGLFVTVSVCVYGSVLIHVSTDLDRCMTICEEINLRWFTYEQVCP